MGKGNSGISAGNGRPVKMCSGGVGTQTRKVNGKSEKICNDIIGPGYRARAELLAGTSQLHWVLLK
jgi:hypothetical protein